MAEYQLAVTTGDMESAGTLDHIYVTLFGTEGQSERTELDNFGIDFKTGTTGNYTVKTSSSLGKLLLVKMEKDPFLCLPEDEWYFSKVVVTTPEGDVILFPCYRWISRGELVELRGGRAMKGFEEEHRLLIDHRERELIIKKSVFEWNTMAEGLPHINNFNMSELPAEIRYSKSKLAELDRTSKLMEAELNLKGMLASHENWESIEDMKKIFWWKKTALSEYVAEHWKEDYFYGYQFLNGVNPNMIKRCSELPPNFPVTEEMVQPFLKTGSSLQWEMEKGNIFLVDHKRIDDIPPRAYNGEPLQVTGGLCLFYMNPENKLMPIAIQLHQQPSEQNPIFLPSDTETDWLLAKMFFKNADCMEHQAVYHLLNTHYLAEVYAVSTLRNFAVIHPIYKSTLGSLGLTELMRRAHSETTYNSLCLPENITARGMQYIPNFYYRDDGLMLWITINRFVKAVVEYYYPSDTEVQLDTELQEWIREIFIHGFFENEASGFPSSFDAVDDVSKFITMVIFTVTVQHAAVNSGQYDYYSWVANSTLLLRKPPPTTKGNSSMETILETLPNVGETVSFASLFWLLSEKYKDTVNIGSYPEERFDEPAVKRMILNFQTELSRLSETIAARNSELEVPYTYLNPTETENSVTI